MSDAVLPRNINRDSGAAVTTSRVPIVVDPDVRVSTGGDEDVSTLSELQKSWLRPEFTEALIGHMSRAKRLAILDHQE